MVAVDSSSATCTLHCFSSFVITKRLIQVSVAKLHFHVKFMQIRALADTMKDFKNGDLYPVRKSMNERCNWKVSIKRPTELDFKYFCCRFNRRALAFGCYHTLLRISTFVKINSVHVLNHWNKH